MPTTFMPRSAWTSTGAAGSTITRPRGIAVHWPGVPSGRFAGRSRDAVAAIIQGWRRLHMAAPRGWADVAYNFVIDHDGRVWELRGMRRKSAANGSATLNSQYLAVNLLLGPDEAIPPPMAQAFADLRERVLAAHPGADVVTTHQAIRPGGTACPGPAGIRFVQARGWTAVPTPAPRPTAPPRPVMPMEDVVKALPNLSRALGSNGFHVRLLEGALTAHLHVLKDPNGNFGPDTEAQVRQFQQARGLPATGVVDGATWQRLLGV